MPGPRSGRDAAAGRTAGAAVLVEHPAAAPARAAVHGEHGPASRVREPCRAGTAAGPGLRREPGGRAVPAVPAGVHRGRRPGAAYTGFPGRDPGRRMAYRRAPGGEDRGRGPGPVRGRRRGRAVVRLALRGGRGMAAEREGDDRRGLGAAPAAEGPARPAAGAAGRRGGRPGPVRRAGGARRDPGGGPGPGPAPDLGAPPRYRPGRPALGDASLVHAGRSRR